MNRNSYIPRDLFCFGVNKAIRQCTVSETIGLCQIIDDRIVAELCQRSCQRTTQGSASVNIYDSDSVTMMTMKYN